MNDEQQHDTSPETEAEKPAARPVKKAPKMALHEQSAFLLRLLSRCVMHTGGMKGSYAGVASLMLTEDDMLALEVVQQSIAVFELYKADQWIMEQRRRRGGGGGARR